MDKLHIVKLGGGLLEDSNATATALASFHALTGHKILVHGGGSQASVLCEKLGIEPKMHNGRRITDDNALDVAVMVYAGLANKTVVAGLQKLGTNAIGVSGADANLIQANKRPVQDIDYGWAGDISSVNTKSLKAFLSIGLSPVFCAITHDQNGQLLNTNADTIAATVASSLVADYEVYLHYCFGHAGVLKDIKDENSVIPTIEVNEVEELHHKGIIADGMLPKLQNAVMALQHGVQAVTIEKPETVHDEQALKTTVIG
jgi:acetylglutamate kinase